MFAHLSFICLLAVTLTTARHARSTAPVTSSPVTSPTSNIPRMWCPYDCDCDGRTREVNCSYRKLTKVPKDIPMSTKKLILTGNELKEIPNRAFWMLRHLQILELDGNNIENISRRLFRKLRKLNKLDLSSNKLERIPSLLFKKLGKLKTLLLRRNKLGKLPVDAFTGLSQVTEIDLSENVLQTLEMDTFSGLTSLKELYLHGNRWHCDCLLKNVEKSLRKRTIRTGYLVCDSPASVAGGDLREVETGALCGTKEHLLVGTLLGAMSGLIAALFAIFMCRRRAAANIDVNDASTAGSELTEPRKRSGASSRSSMISVDSGQYGDAKKSENNLEKKKDLFTTSCELNVGVLAPLASTSGRDNDVMLTSSSDSTRVPATSSSCPNFADFSLKLDQFVQDKK